NTKPSTMKKRILLMAIAAGFCFLSPNAQTTKQDSCAELKAMFDESLYVLDSIMGNQIELKKQLDSIRADVTKKKAEVDSILKKQNETSAALIDARKLIS